MTAILSQIFELLTVPPGNLTYHLVLAFSAAGALQAAVNNWRVSDYPQARRLMLGLALLLLTRLVLFGGAAFSWQGLTNDHLLMPPLDQALGLLSVVILIWLWAFPEPVRGGDAASLLLGLVILTLATLNMVWWTRDGAELAYNAWLPNRIGSAVALALLTSGVLLLLTRRPNNWGLGFGMFLALSAGHLTALLLPQTQGDYSGVLRLTQMAAFPLLLALPQRFALQAARLAGEAGTPAQAATTRGVPALDQQSGSEALQAALELSGESEPAQLAHNLARLVARAVVADICLILSPPDPQGQMTCLGAYDLIRDEKLDPGALTSQALPVLSAALKRGLPLRLPASSTSPDLINLAQALKLGRTGPLLAAPVLARPADPLAGLALLTPYSNRSWTKDDQARLEQIAAGVARIFLRLEETLDREHEVREARLHLQAAQAESRRLQQENMQLVEASHEADQSLQNQRAQAASLAALLAAHDEAQEAVQRLTNENRRLQAALLNTPEASLPAETPDGELRLALEEIASLRTALTESEHELSRLQRAGIPGQSGALSAVTTSGSPAVAALAHELRQPLSAVMGYTDFLLGESVGILGALQRKFLEKVRVSTQRMSRLVDTLIQISSAETAQLSEAGEIMELNGLIDQAVDQVHDRLMDKAISLSLEIPEQLPGLSANRSAIQKTLTSLLENAVAISPAESEIVLRSQLSLGQNQLNGREYVLLQVVDQGPGIPSEQLAQVFQSHTSGEPLRGLGLEASAFPELRKTVENLGGRIWVENSPGSGAAFSLLLPVAAAETQPGQHHAGEGSRL